MHIAGAVHQNIERAEFAADHLGHRIDIVLRPHVELEPLRCLNLADLVFGDIGGDDFATFLAEGLGDGAADALPGCGDQRDFTFQPVAHYALLRRSMLRG